jgi:hypothetical protein
MIYRLKHLRRLRHGSVHHAYHHHAICVSTFLVASSELIRANRVQGTARSTLIPRLIRPRISNEREAAGLGERGTETCLLFSSALPRLR